MKFSVAKCNSMTMTKHPLPKQIIHDYSHNSQVLENVLSAKCLGITVTQMRSTRVNTSTRLPVRQLRHRGFYAEN